MLINSQHAVRRELDEAPIKGGVLARYVFFQATSRVGMKWAGTYVVLGSVEEEE